MPKKKELMVFENRGEVFTTSVVIAHGIGYPHHQLTRLIERHIDDFKEFGLIRFENGLVRERSAKVYRLNQEQFLLLITYLRATKKASAVNELKKEMVNAFKNLIKMLEQRKTAEWQEARALGKTYRRAFTDAVQAYVGYCEEHGSQNASRYYTTLTAMINKAVGCECRDNATASQIAQIYFIEDNLARLLFAHMAQGTEYHDIFCDCKARAQAIMAVTTVPLLTA